MPLAWAFVVERVTGIEPALSAWEADVLPLNYTRIATITQWGGAAEVQLTKASSLVCTSRWVLAAHSLHAFVTILPTGGGRSRDTSGALRVGQLTLPSASF